MRRAVSSFHNDTIASGHGSPARTVASTNAAPDVARCKTSAAEIGSSSCASSTPITTSRPPARLRSSSPQRLISATMSSGRASSGTSSATAARGTAEALRVACTQSTNAPLRSAATCASLARRDFPTPASATRTTPWQRGLARADAIASSSRSRPTSGHAPGSASTCPSSPGIFNYELYALDKSALRNGCNPGLHEPIDPVRNAILARRGAGHLGARQSRAKLLGLDRPQRVGPRRADEYGGRDPAELVAEAKLGDPPRQFVEREP